MIMARGNLHNTSKATDLHWSQSEGSTIIPELPVVISTPSPRGSIALERKRVIKPSRYISNSAQATDLHWGNPISGAVIPELCAEIVAPCPNSAIALERKGMGGAASDGYDPS